MNLKGKKFTKDISLQAAVNQHSAIGEEIGLSHVEQQPDKGWNYYDIRLLILDTANEWVDFTELEGIQRLASFPDEIEIGAETNVPYVFKSSSMTINLNNSDYLFDNLRKTKLITILGNPALFDLNSEGTNYDLRGREVKIIGRTAHDEMTTEYELAHFYVKSISTNSDGTAKLDLDSAETPFLQAQANKVKDGRNWYFDRSVDFLVKELIKSVRREYNNGIEVIPDNDVIAISNVETSDASTATNEGARVFSEYGRPIAEIKYGYSQNDIAGEKRFIVTAATPRNILRTKLYGNVSIGSNYIRIKIDDNIWLRKGDVLTIGKQSAADWSLLNEEKVTVLEDIEFNDNIQSVKVSALTKNHLTSDQELVERWIIYLGVSRKIEGVRENNSTTVYTENYILAFDPDRDQFANLTTLANSGTNLGALRHPLRYLGLTQTLKDPFAGSDAPCGVPTVSKLIGVGCTYTYPGKPNENGTFLAWTINTLEDWDNNSTHLTLNTETQSLIADGGIYTGEMCFRSLSSMADNSYMYSDDPNQSVIPTERFGAQGLGQFVPEAERRVYDPVMQAYKLVTPQIPLDSWGRFCGYGYFASLATDIAGTINNPIKTIEVYCPTIDSNNRMGFTGHPNISGTLYLIGCDSSSDDSEENFYYSAQIKKSDTILYGKMNIVTSGKFIYELQNGIDVNFKRKNTIVLIVPNTGKMYVKNCGENLLISEPQNITFAGYDKSVSASSALDTDDFEDSIKLEKKKEIDSKVTIVATERKLIDSTAIDRGYYNSVVKRKNLRVQKGDVITESDSQFLFNSAAMNIRVVPSQYTARPFCEDDIMEIYNESTGDSNNKGFGIPIFDGQGQVIEGSLDPTIAPTANNHVWNIPIIGLWAKYDKASDTLFSFDGTKLSDNGNSELLGYWYLAYETPYSQNFHPSDLYSEGIPTIGLAIADKNGMVIVNGLARMDDFDNYFNTDHIPLCTVIHNIWDGADWGGEKFGVGKYNATFEDYITSLLGGDFVTKTFTYNGVAVSYSVWNPQGSEFSNTFPCSKWNYPTGSFYSGPMKIIWKFKKLKDPQTNGSLFVSPFCTPVRPYHIHYPFTDSGTNDDYGNPVNTNLNFTTDITVKQDIEIDESNFSNIPFIENSTPGFYKTMDGYLRVPFDIIDTDNQLPPVGAIIRLDVNQSFPSYPVSAKILMVTSQPYGSTTMGQLKVDYDYDTYITDINFNGAGCFWSIQEETYTGYSVDTNFLDGSEERYNYLNSAENNPNNRLLWVADRFSHSKILGMIYGVGGSRNSEGMLGGFKITDINDEDRQVTIPIGYYYGKTNLLTFDVPYEVVFNIELGDIYMRMGSHQYGYLVVMGIIENGALSKIICRLYPNRDDYIVGALPTTGYLKPIDPLKTNQTGELINYTNYTGTINRNGAETPSYDPECIEHLDIKPESPIGLEEDHLYVSLYKINFKTGPTLLGAVNYPRALYAKCLHKFWYYNRRVARSYLGGDGKYDSEIKPTAWGAFFFDSAAKYYLSRTEHTRDGIDYIDCDCYTPNYDGTNLGDEDNLYAIVHVNFYNTVNYNIYPFVKFNLGYQKNFKLDPFTQNVIYFARRQFQVNPEGKVFIDSTLSKYDYNSGAPAITNIATFPNSLYETFNSIDESTPTDHNDIDENITDTESNEIDENPESDSDDIRMMGDFELHGIFKSYQSEYPYCGLMQWRNSGMVELTYADKNLTSSPKQYCYSRKYYYDPIVTYKGFSQPYFAKQEGVVWALHTWADIAGANSKINITNDINGNDADLFIVKGWVEELEEHIYSATPYDSIKGIIAKRHQLLYEAIIGEAEAEAQDIRNQREYLGAFALKAHAGIYDIGLYDSSYSSHMFTSIRKFTFKVTSMDGYFVADTYDNSVKKWNGSTLAGVITEQGDAQPCVEGDFNQYELMIKIPSAYEEVFGFSSGPRIHLASASLKGGRNIIWKLSKSLAFHIAVADFENLTVWEALSQLAELTNSLISFDRMGRLHFETRPYLAVNSPYVFTLDKIEYNNIISIDKNPAFDKIYNHIEMIPYKPILPEPKIDLTTASDINTISANNELFITDMGIEAQESDKNKARPVITAYQKDFERKKILLICNDGQFDTGSMEERGIYSRWKYMIINDPIELRLTQTATKAVSPASQYIYVNQIPFDDISGQLLIKKGNYLYIGNNDAYQISSDPDYIDVENKRIKLTSYLPVNISYQAGLPIKIIDSEDGKNEFHATGSGAYKDRLTYSPHSGFYAEIGEWFFDDSQLRTPMKLMKDLNVTDTYLYLDTITNLDNYGFLSINGDMIVYRKEIGNKLRIITGPIEAHKAGSAVFKMPPTINSDIYNPGTYRIGGYDEIGPSCKTEYHLYDPNEDGYPYYDDSPLLGGKPISALDFYWEGQKLISYTDDSGITAMENKSTVFEGRIRHRTFASMKIEFNGFRFSDGDKIDIDFPGIKLEQQTHLKKTFSDYESIQTNGMKSYSSDNRFFNAKTAIIVGERILRSLSNIGNNVEVVAKMSDIRGLDYKNIVRIIDRDMFPSIHNNEVIGYVSNFRINLQKKQVTINSLTNRT